MPNDLDKRYQTQLVLWFAILMSVVLWVGLTLFVPSEGNDELSPSFKSTMIFGLAAIGTFLVIVSFAVKQKFLRLSVERQDPALVQKGLVFAIALCEVSGLFAVLEHFVIGNREYYLLFILAVAGIILHFPRRSHLEAASNKNLQGSFT